ncbi:uncharacterized protein LOC120196509 [Hibiscus syriacus]|uniref:uncharacterized protein LOC120196509 n=1 Tax=Hibiscus syriacus TaxID=106335 RepID=UPI001920F764|nr:uncharacterized protein LOC120196509 [Hibiscus syriacus]
MEAEYKSVVDRAANVVTNPVYHAHTKHVDLDIHFVREKVVAKLMRVNYVPATHQIADGLTKPLARNAFEEFRAKFGQIPSVEFSKKVHERIDHSMRRSIIVRLLGRKIGYKTLLNRIQLLWKPKGRFQVVDLDSDYYIVMFEIEEDYNHVLSDGPWTVYIAEIIGKVIKIDYNTLVGDRGKFARLAVMVNLNKLLIPSIRIDGIVRQLEYEWLHQICCTCGTYGHSFETCGASSNTSITEDKNNKEVHNNLNKDNEIGSIYDPWMITASRKRQP